MVIILKSLEEKMDRKDIKMENFNKEIENFKIELKDVLELRNLIFEIRIFLMSIIVDWL